MGSTPRDSGKPRKASLYSEYDAAWKEAISKYFREFVQFFWAEIEDKIDWEKPHRFVEQELNPTDQTITDKKVVRKRIADKVIQVSLKDGNDLCAIVHLEIQGNEDKEFPARVFTYRYRIFDRYHADIATMVVLIDNKLNWRPNVYHYEFWGTRLHLEYPIVKILDYASRENELRQSRNPFALVVLAQLTALKTSPSQEDRRISKLELVKFLYMHGLEREQVFNLLRFLDEILVLEPSLAVKYVQDLKKFEEENKMAFITQTEKMFLSQGIEKGIEKGVLMGEKKALEQFIRLKFSNVPEKYHQKIQEADEPEINHWLQSAFQGKNLDDIFSQ